MADEITLEVARYRPELESEPVMQSLPGAAARALGRSSTGSTYIKDQLDGTLSFRWSCRMGICGSCGMTVNGEPQLTCATFLTDYAPGPIRVEPLRNFPVIRDLVVDIGDFMAKLPKVKPWLIRDVHSPVEEGEYLQTPEELDEYKQFSMCINCMLCYSACPVYAPRTGPSSGRRRSRWPSGTTSTRATRAPRSGATSCPRRKGSGPAPSSASAARRARRASTRRARSSGTS